MQNNKVITQDLLVSISSILIFISVAYFINLNGFEKFAPFLIVVGLAMLYFSDFFTNFFKNIKIIGKPVIFTLSHIMIFIGSKVYLDKYVAPPPPMLKHYQGRTRIFAVMFPNQAPNPLYGLGIIPFGAIVDLLLRAFK